MNPRRIAQGFGLVLLGCLALAGAAQAEIGTIDDVPAATLLLPYFEVDLDDPSGLTTLFSVNNASATAGIVHIVLWTDKSIPTLDFDCYLTGYDVQTINMRDIFNGILCRTADDGVDPFDTISPQGPLSQDINFPGSTGPCAVPYNAPPTPTLSATLIEHLRQAHTGGPSPIFGGQCAGADYGDNIARGYVTMDTVNSCNLSFPTDPGYATVLLTNQNILWGDYFYINPGQNFAQGETLVHIEACSNPVVGGPAATLECPYSIAAGDYTFYGRYVSVAGQDQREALATTFATRFAEGGGFDGGTDLLVWRDAKTTLNSTTDQYSCSSGNVAWFPLGQSDVVAFDEEEDATNLCFRGDNISPATGGEDVCFPLETQRIHVGGGNVIADDMGVPYPFGWLYLNLNHSIAGDPFPGVAQAWVTTVMDAEGRFSVGFDAIKLDSAQNAVSNGVILIP